MADEQLPTVEEPEGLNTEEDREPGNMPLDLDLEVPTEIVVPEGYVGPPGADITDEEEE